MTTGIRIENNKLVYGLESCVCMDGKNYGTSVCPSCNGTRRGKRGGKNSCRTCYCGTVVDTNKLVTCQRCDGTAKIQATRYSRIPDSLFSNLTFVVYRGNKRQTFAEEWGLDIGSVYSCTDYGRHKNMSDEELIATVKQSRMHQGCTIADKDDNVCKHVGIFTNEDGYTVKAVF